MRRMQRTPDILIRGGQVVDGLGNPPQRADVAVASDRIEAVGVFPNANASVVLDAEGAVVCPGFIDAHSHSDAYLLIEPSAASKIFQGITTEITGNCGASAAPRFGPARLPADWEALLPEQARWTTMAEYLSLLRQARPAVNVFPLAGHNVLRAGVTGYVDRPATDEEIRLMRRRLEEALEQGAHGLSTGLIYPPGLFAQHSEIQTLVSAAAAAGGIYTTHLRSEGAGLLESVSEAISFARNAGARLQISHLKTSGPANWHLADCALDLIRRARDQGLPVAADRYPYTASATELDAVLPRSAAAGGRDGLLRLLRDPRESERLAEELDSSRESGYWDSVMIGSTYNPSLRALRGRRISEIAMEQGLSPGRAVVMILREDLAMTGAFFFGMSEANMRKILSEPWVMIGSDASLRAPTGPLASDYPHPRAYGTFPRFIRMALDERLCPIEEAVRKMTSLPASHFRIADRGAIRPGWFADIVVFDPEAMRDLATYDNPHRPAEGLRHLIVNGAITIRDGKLTGQRAGRIV